MNTQLDMPARRPPQRPEGGRTPARAPQASPGRRPPAGAAAPTVRRRKPHKHPHADVRRYYKLFIQLGLVLALGLVTALFRMPVRPPDEPFELTLAEQEVVQMEEIQQTQQEAKPPPPPRPPVPVEVPDDEVIEEDELDLDATLDIDEPLTDLPPPPAPAEEEQVVEEEPEIFVVVEEMPEIIGGTARIYEYLEYPDMARQAGLEGLVVVQIVVETDGTPTQPTIARSAGSVLDEAAIKAVMQLRFKPGKQRGVPVRVRMAIPIRFKLRDMKNKG